jgi:hypothetical protein
MRRTSGNELVGNNHVVNHFSKGGFMKRFESGKAYLVCMVIMSIFVSILSGCGGSGGGHWNDPATPGAPGALAVTVVSPIAGSTVPTNTKVITASFNKEMAPATLTPASFTLACNATPITGGVVTYLTAGSLATLTLPAADLPASSPCTATITTAAKDLTGTALATAYSWNFTTAADTTNPRVSSTVPLTSTPGPTGVLTSTPITATFDKVMNAATITAVGAFTVSGVTATNVTYDDLSKTATFHPASPLAAGVTYTATIKGTGVAPVKDSTGNILAGDPLQPTVANDYQWRFTTAAVLPLNTHLGTAATYGIMATSAITNTGVTTHVNGDVALQPGASNGLQPTQVTGAIHINDSASNIAYQDLLIAYNYYKGLPRGTTITGGADLGGLYPGGVIAPGTYTSDSTMLINTPITLDAGGDPNALWVFQIGSSLTTSTPQGNVLLLNGAQARNVYWVPTASATIGVNTIFNGTVVAGVSITGQTGAVINGRLLAGAIGAGTIALDTNQVTVPAP